MAASASGSAALARGGRCCWREASLCSAVRAALNSAVVVREGGPSGEVPAPQSPAPLESAAGTRRLRKGRTDGVSCASRLRLASAASEARASPPAAPGVASVMPWCRRCSHSDASLYILYK